METSALELYKKAYDLHYVQRKIPEACQIYKAIIERLPDSNEAAYAAVQLQKVQATDAARLVRSGGGHGKIVVLAMAAINLIFLIVAITVVSSISSSASKQNHSVVLLCRAVATMNSGRADEALALLDSVKLLSSQDITPFALAAEIYLQKKQYAYAMGQYEIFQKLYPGTSIPFSEISRIRKAEEQSSAVLKIPPPVVPAVEEQAAVSEEQSKAEPKRSARTRSSRSSDSEKPKLLINPDSLSYF